VGKFEDFEELKADGMVIGVFVGMSVIVCRFDTV